MTWRTSAISGSSLLIGLTLIGLTYRHGGTQSVIVYVAALPLLTGIAMAMATDESRDDTWALTLRIGVGVLLVGAALVPSLRALGFLHLALGLGVLVAVRALVLGTSLRDGWYWLALLAGLGCLEVFYAVLQIAGWVPRFHPTGVISGTFMNPNHFGGFLGLTAPIGVGLLLSSSGRRAPRPVKVVGWALIVVGGLCVAASRSAGGLLAYGVGLAVAGSLVWLGRKERSQRFKLAVAAGLVVSTVLALVPLIAIEAGEEGGRAMLFGDVLRMISDHWLTGVGPGLFRWRYLEYQSGNFDDRYDFAHNDLLEHVVELGVVGGGLLWCFLLWRLYRVVAGAMSHQAEHRSLLCGGAGALASIHLHASFDFDLHIVATWVAFCALHGVLWALTSRGRADSDRVGGSGWRRVVRYGVVAAVMGALVVTSLRLAGALEVARAANLSGSDRESALRSALRLDSTNALALDSLRQELEAEVGDDDESRMAEAIALGERAVLANPFHWSYRRSLARLYARTGSHDEAERQYREAVRLAPQVASYGEYHWELGTFLLSRDAHGDGLERLRRALELEPALSERTLALLVAMGFDDAEVEAVFPGEGLARRRLGRLLERRRERERR